MGIARAALLASSPVVTCRFSLYACLALVLFAHVPQSLLLTMLTTALLITVASCGGGRVNILESPSSTRGTRECRRYLRLRQNPGLRRR
jgi:hypothetical protein